MRPRASFGTSTTTAGANLDHRFIWSRLKRARAWRRVMRERLTEPLHLNLFSALVGLFGSFRAKVEHDLILRPHNAFAILRAADYAKRMGLDAVTLVEFGVARGAGLINMSRIAERVTQVTGVRFEVYGFDTGAGMPPPTDYRDHPDLYAPGDFRMDPDALRRVLPSNAHLVLGDVSATVKDFLASVSPKAPIGYVVFDLDYYSSTMAAFGLLLDPNPSKYLPVTLAFFDDVLMDRHNSWAGELLAIREFNQMDLPRKIERHAPLARTRLYSHAYWLDQMFFLHTMDHPSRQRSTTSAARVLENPYLSAHAK
jgi:hypothetical protein